MPWGLYQRGRGVRRIMQLLRTASVTEFSTEICIPRCTIRKYIRGYYTQFLFVVFGNCLLSQFMYAMKACDFIFLRLETSKLAEKAHVEATEILLLRFLPEHLVDVRH